MQLLLRVALASNVMAGRDQCPPSSCVAGAGSTELLGLRRAYTTGHIAARRRIARPALVPVQGAVPTAMRAGEESLVAAEGDVAEALSKQPGAGTHHALRQEAKLRSWRRAAAKGEHALQSLSNQKLWPACGMAGSYGRLRLVPCRRSRIDPAAPLLGRGGVPYPLCQWLSATFAISAEGCCAQLL